MLNLFGMAIVPHTLACDIRHQSPGMLPDRRYTLHAPGIICKIKGYKMTDAYPGFNVLLMGPAGTGKTYAIRTLADAGLETFVLFLEPGAETLIGAYADEGKPIPPNLHWHFLQSKTTGFGQLAKVADSIGKFDLSGLAKMRDIDRAKNNPIIPFYESLNDFQDQTGKKFGSIDSWGTDKVFVIDSLSALNTLVMEMVVGTKPVKDQADWGIAQNHLMSLLHRLTSGCLCHFVLIAHVDREVDQIMGGVKLMPSTLGKAITGQLPRPFSDVILTAREGDKWFWDTASSNADVKTRNLPVSSKLPADFGAIYKKWKSRRDAK